MTTNTLLAPRWRRLAWVLLTAGRAAGCGEADSDDDGGDVGTDDGSVGDAAETDPTEPGGDGGSSPPLSDSECALAFSITGAVVWTTAAPPACAIPFGGDEGIWMNYVFGSSPVEAVEVDVDEVTEGSTGTFPATVRIRHADGRRFDAADCSVTIDAHVAEPDLDDEFSRAYVVHATGTCPTDAVDDDTQDAVTVAPFELSFPAHWAS